MTGPATGPGRRLAISRALGALALALALSLGLAPEHWSAGAGHGEGPIAGEAPERASAADFWRAIRGGEAGVVVVPGPGAASSGVPGQDCVLIGNCTERAVGFVVPVHADMPVIREPEGVGARPGALALVALLAVGAAVGLVGFMAHLGGRDRRGAAEDGR